ncbi:type VI secretion system baseplate subunit TssG [Uliginosibacterium sp. 31-16]|uniref:type VI secretion system baseplate subunit TssG n=1 Tax=Uliginosibacterium sp. 31-16 TaxID=3068315 RepID=UPI00273DF4D4|nr:type VI secretion system baseplate subunit TssG [Uliginosibacterium sp. 31-16]MDP5240058.1 type VI secretion system baseplate subunit TssG [Uliginosibacterium sp. 31-16]
MTRLSPQTFYARLEAEPFAHDFYQTMRRLECLHLDKPRWGMALRPADEPVRIGQEPSLAFAPASLASFRRERDDRPPRLEIRFFGLLGANGPLPLHLTDHARQRILHSGDATFSRFLDILHHRFAALFYRAWAQAQPTVSLDRPDEDRFAGYVGALCGIGQPTLQRRDAVPDNARRFHAGALSRQVRNGEGLASVLAGFFKLPVEVEQFVGHWMPIEEADQSRLGSSQLGRNAVLGSRVWDRQSKFRIHIGPLTVRQYADFLPSGSALPKLVDWVRFYTGGELFWDVQLILRRQEVPTLMLGRSGLLGWSGWLGTPQMADDAGDLVLDAERVMDARHA